MNPTANLDFNATYTINILGGASGVADHANNILATTYTSSFTTEASDTTLPTVSSVIPANGASEILATSNVSAVFDEAMDESTINTTNFELRDSYNALVPAGVSYDAVTNTALLDPLGSFNYGAVYTARIIGGSNGVKDIAGNALVADYSWSFTITTPPSINSVSPNSGAIDVLIASDVSAIFSKAMDENSINAGTFVLHDSAENPIAASISYNNTTHTATLNPSSNLAYSTSYHATLLGGSNGVKDVVGNPLAADYTWSFTTESMITTPPTVTSAKPINGVSDLRLETKATAYFSRAMDPLTINSDTFQLTYGSGTLVPATITYNAYKP